MSSKLAKFSASAFFKVPRGPSSTPESKSGSVVDLGSTGVAAGLLGFDANPALSRDSSSSLKRLGGPRGNDLGLA